MSRDSLLLTSKFVTSYSKLFKGLTPEQISPKDTPETFWSNLLALDVDVEFLSNLVSTAPKEACLDELKPLFKTLFSTCLVQGKTALYDDPRKSHAIVTLSVISRWVLQKNLAGFEVMEVFAGTVSHSDHVFMELISMMDGILKDDNAPASIRHQVLQLAVVFVCGIGQLSPGAYLLRRDLFPAIATIIKSPETEQFAFEASLLLALLANFHKSDAANLNPYLKQIHNTEDKELMRTICWAANFAAEAAVKSYQSLSDDSPQTFTPSVGSLLSLFRPDRVLADPPRDLFKAQPIEAAVILMPLHEFLNVNPMFASVLTEPLTANTGGGARVSSLPFTFVTLASYVLTHATSSSTPRALAYANLSLHILLKLVESSAIISCLCEQCPQEIRLCRQRVPYLPLVSKSRPPVCAILDCCVLWLRHNLHKRLEVYSYLICIRICYQVIWYLQKQHVRPEYHWVEFWRALLGVLEFLSKQFSNLNTKGGFGPLVQEIISLLDLSIVKAEVFLPTPKALHEFIYELVRSSEIIKSQQPIFESLGWSDRGQRRASYSGRGVTESLSNLISLVDYYGGKIGNANSANYAMKVVAREVDKDGLVGIKDIPDVDYRPKQVEDVVGLIRYAYIDAMSLMP